MRHSSTGGRLRSLTLGTVLLMSLSGCYSWHTEPFPSPEVLNRGRDARVTLVNGEQHVLRPGALMLGRVSGFVEGDGIISVPVQDVRRIEFRHIDPVASAVLGVGVASLVLGIATYLAVAVGMSSWGR